MTPRCGSWIPLLLMLSTATHAGFWGDVGNWGEQHIIQPVNHHVIQPVAHFVNHHVVKPITHVVTHPDDDWNRFTQLCNKKWNALGDWTTEELKELKKGLGLGSLRGVTLDSIKTEVMLKLGEAVDNNFLGIRDALQEIDDGQKLNGALMTVFGAKWTARVVYNRWGDFSSGHCDWDDDAQKHPENYLLKSITVWRQPLFQKIVGIQEGTKEGIQLASDVFKHSNTLVSHMMRMAYNIAMTLDHWYVLIDFERRSDGRKIWMRKERLMNGIGFFSATYYRRLADAPEFDNYECYTNLESNDMGKYAEVVKKTEYTGNYTLAHIKKMGEDAAALGHYNVLDRNCQSLCKWIYETLGMGDLSKNLDEDDQPAPNVSR